MQYQYSITMPSTPIGNGTNSTIQSCYLGGRRFFINYSQINPHYEFAAVSDLSADPYATGTVTQSIVNHIGYREGSAHQTNTLYRLAPNRVLSLFNSRNASNAAVLTNAARVFEINEANEINVVAEAPDFCVGTASMMRTGFAYPNGSQYQSNNDFPNGVSNLCQVIPVGNDRLLFIGVNRLTSTTIEIYVADVQYDAVTKNLTKTVRFKSPAILVQTNFVGPTYSLFAQMIPGTSKLLVGVNGLDAASTVSSWAGPNPSVNPPSTNDIPLMDCWVLDTQNNFTSSPLSRRKGSYVLALANNRFLEWNGYAVNNTRYHRTLTNGVWSQDMVAERSLVVGSTPINNANSLMTTPVSYSTTFMYPLGNDHFMVFGYNLMAIMRITGENFIQFSPTGGILSNMNFYGNRMIMEPRRWHDPTQTSPHESVMQTSAMGYSFLRWTPPV